MNNQQIIACYKRNEKPRKMRANEIDDLCSKIKYPFPGIKEIVDSINARFNLICRICVADLKFPPSFIPVYIDNIYKTFLLATEDPGAPVGPRTADAIGQQAMQGLLNLFHQTGASKPGGAQGIKENIGISTKREQTYMTLNFMNQRYTAAEVLDLKGEFMGMNIEKLCTSIRTFNVNINDHIDHDQPLNEEESIEMANNGKYWWYKYCHYDKIDTDNVRIAVRFTIDVIKLCSLKLTTCDIANKLSSIVYSISLGKSTKKDDSSKEKYKLVCLPSPTYLGIIDGFLISSIESDPNDYKKDYFLQKSVANRDYSYIYIGGIEGIENFYPVERNVTSCIQSVEPAFETIIDENGKKKKIPKGTWVYLKNMRFEPVPINRLISLCKSCGIEAIEDPEAVSFDNLEFNAHKLRRELRRRLEIEVLVRDEGELTRNFRLDKNDKVRIVKYKEKLFTEKTERKFGPEQIIYFTSQKKCETVLEEDVEFKSKEQIDEVLVELNDLNHKNHKKRVKQLFEDVDPELSHYCLQVSYKTKEKDSAKFDNVLYIHVLICNKLTVEIEINNIEVNSPKNYITLDTAIISTYAMKDLSIPAKYRLPKVTKVLEVISHKDNENIREGILLNTFLPFRKDYSNSLKFDDEPEKENDDEYKKLKKEELSKAKKQKPHEILIAFLDSNADANERTYVYAETKGSALLEVCCHKLIDPTKTMCNVFEQVNLLFGNDALRNLIAFDLKSVIDISGYIHRKYPVHIADVATSNGINRFTSSGNSNQRTGPISAMSFDNTKANIIKYSTTGKFFSIFSSSTAIFTGYQIPLGTGYVRIHVDISELAPETKLIENNISVFTVTEAEVEEESQITIFPITIGKFPEVKSITAKYIVPTAGYYLNICIKDFKTARVQKRIGMSFTIFKKRFSGMKTTIDKSVLNLDDEDNKAEKTMSTDEIMGNKASRKIKIRNTEEDEEE